MEKLYKKLANYGTIDIDKSLSEMTTLRIGGKARLVIYPETDISIDPIIDLLKEYNFPYKVIGKGSDLLCSDDDYEGAIIRLDKHFNNVYFEDNEIVAQGGASIISLSIEAMKHGLSGLEFASGIPGTIGGAIYMNAGAYKSSISEVLSEVFVYHDGAFSWMKKEECEFGYRSSCFQKHPDWIILGAKLILKEGNSKEIAKLMEDRRERRMATQPLDAPSCGSVFRNPENYNAWELIEGIGYRGKTLGGAKVSEKHCNFILNDNNASANDYLSLVRDIQVKVKEKYNVDLETEMEMFNWK